MSDRQQRLIHIIDDAVARSSDIDSIVIGARAIDRVPDLLHTHFPDRPALLIADGNTRAAAGERVATLLRGAGIDVRTHLFPGTPLLKPTLENAAAIGATLAAADAVPVAVGSGVINDLVKYAAYKADRRYLCIATAASMDGYAGAGAPLLESGFKITTPCRPPAVIVGDLDVIASAPAEMTGWGFGDLAGKVPAAGDWILADALGVEPIDDVAWPLVQDNVRDWLAAFAAAPAGDHEATALLFGGLVITGLAMEFYGNSRPASGADHQIGHVWEMEGLTYAGRPVSHGAAVAVGAISVLALYEWLLARDFDALDVDALVDKVPNRAAVKRQIASLFDDPVVADRALQESALKPAGPDLVRDRLMRLQASWPALKSRLARPLMPARDMQTWLRAAGVARRAADIGIDPARHRRTIERARFIRRRYTILDLLAETGLWTEALDALDAVDGATMATGSAETADAAR